MKVEFTNRAVGDLRRISIQSRKEFGAPVAAALELRIRNVVEQIANAPESAPRAARRAAARHARASAGSLSVQNFLPNCWRYRQNPAYPAHGTTAVDGGFVGAKARNAPSPPSAYDIKLNLVGGHASLCRPYARCRIASFLDPIGVDRGQRFVKKYHGI